MGSIRKHKQVFSNCHHSLTLSMLEERILRIHMLQPMPNHLKFSKSLFSLILVALNYQTEDKQNFINRARFCDNGGSGYVLKPDFLRDHSIPYSPNSPSRLDDKGWKIGIKIISGQHIPKAEGSDDIIDPYVKIRLRGHPDDEVDSDGEKINKGKTESVKNNGFNPLWNETFQFESKVGRVKKSCEK